MKTHRFLSLVLVLILAFSLSVYAQAAVAGDPNPNRDTLTLSETSALYENKVHVAYADRYEWPSGGTVLVQVAGKYTISDLNGVTIPANLIVDVYQVSGNQYSFLVRYDTTDGKSITVTDAYNDAKNGTIVAGFSDVRTANYYADAVKWAVNKNITNGTSATTFSPANTVTRAEAVTFLWRAAGCTEPSSTVSTFIDVTDTSAYYYKAILWATENGIINGVGDGKFDPQGTLSYDHILAMLCRASGNDASGSNWSAAAVNWAAENGLTDGLNFTAKANCPRSDVVYCLWKQLSDDTETQLPVGNSNLEGAKSAIITGLLQAANPIDVSSYQVESSALLELVEDIINVDGYDNYYGVSGYWCLESAGQAAKTLRVRYTTTLEMIEQKRNITTKALEIVAETVKPGMSDYEIAKALHDYIVLNCAYGFSQVSYFPKVTYSGYFALLTGSGVCTDYASGYKVLMDTAGIPCEIVTNATHAWNIVQIDGEWYHVDTTWDDPTPNREGYVRYNYFLKSDTYMSQDHAEWDASHSCTSTKYDGSVLPSSTEQEEQAQQQAQQSQQQAQLDKLIQLCYSAMDDFPYQTEAELQAATDEELSNAYRATIYISESQFEDSELMQFYSQVKEAISSKNANYRLYTFDRTENCYKLYRDDVQREIDRRRSVLQDLENARVAEIQKLIEEAIENRLSYCPLSGYTFTEVKKARNNMTADGYSFGSYTSEDYRLYSYSTFGVNIAYNS